jgi:hypothetical protein
LTQAAAGSARMGIGVAVLTETKFVNNRYPKIFARYTIMSSKAASSAQGGVALAWRGNNPSFEVESVRFYGPNMLTYQLKTGDEQIYAVGRYIPPKLHEGGRGYSPSPGGVPGGMQTAHNGGPERKH